MFDLGIQLYWIGFAVLLFFAVMAFVRFIKDIKKGTGFKILGYNLPAYGGLAGVVILAAGFILMSVSV
jgi:hypothetical protein